MSATEEMEIPVCFSLCLVAKLGSMPDVLVRPNLPTFSPQLRLFSPLAELRSRTGLLRQAALAASLETAELSISYQPVYWRFPDWYLNWVLLSHMPTGLLPLASKRQHPLSYHSIHTHAIFSSGGPPPHKQLQGLPKFFLKSETWLLIPLTWYLTKVYFILPRLFKNLWASPPCP